MIIDEERNFALTNFSKTVSGKKSTDTDHMTLMIELNAEIPKIKTQRVEIYNLRNRESQNVFKENTSNTERFSNCLSDDSALDVQAKRWEKCLKGSIAQSFKKIRITGVAKETDLKIALEERNQLKNKLKNVVTDDELDKINDDIDNIEDLICNMASSQNTK